MKGGRQKGKQPYRDMEDSQDDGGFQEMEAMGLSPEDEFEDEPVLARAAAPGPSLGSSAVGLDPLAQYQNLLLRQTLLSNVDPIEQQLKALQMQSLMQSLRQATPIQNMQAQSLPGLQFGGLQGLDIAAVLAQVKQEGGLRQQLPMAKMKIEVDNSGTPTGSDCKPFEVVCVELICEQFAMVCDPLWLLCNVSFVQGLHGLSG